MSFRQIEGDTAILNQGGVYRQCDLYEWDGKLFAKHGNGFVRLKENGSTSRDGVNIIQLQLDAPLLRDRYGRLCVSSGEGRSTLGQESPLLIGRDD